MEKILAILLVLQALSGVLSVKFTFTNDCPYTIWPGTLTGTGPPLPSSGFQLKTGESSSLDAQPSWSGRVWARTNCSYSSGRFTCATADCGSGQVPCNGGGAVPPASLIEFTLGSGGSQDTYDISLVDGFNLPLSITPQGGKNCSSTSCAADVNSVCPANFSVNGTDGNTIACKSACVALNQPQYCCTGAFNTPQTCPPTDYSKIFKNVCPQAYSYAYDDRTSTFTCSGGADYIFTFCP